MEAQRLLNCAAVHARCPAVGVSSRDFSGFHEAGEGVVDKATLASQVTLSDELLVRVRFEPTRAMPEKLFDLGFANPVVLGAVKDRDQYIEVGE